MIMVHLEFFVKNKIVKKNQKQKQKQKTKTKKTQKVFQIRQNFRIF